MSGSDRANMPADKLATSTATVAFGLVHTIVAQLVAGGSGAGDSVDLIPVGGLPWPKFRVLGIESNISATPGASTVELNTHDGGGGDSLGTLDTTATGKPRALLPNTQPLIVAGAAQGLFAVRSNDNVAGWVTIYCLPVS